MNQIDKFLKKSQQWQTEIELLRAIILKTNLEEKFKWNLPCYSHQGKNIVIIQTFKNCLALMFFKGSLLKDPQRILQDVGPNSRSARRLEFTSVKEIKQCKKTIRAYIDEAISIEESGQKVDLRKRPQPVPVELQEVIAQKPAFRKAFQSLTPGRQRGYILYFSSAKQSATRLSRIEKCTPRILRGKGLNDR